MLTDDQAEATEVPLVPLHDRVRDEHGRLSALARTISAAAQSLAPLAKEASYRDPSKLGKAVVGAQAKVPAGARTPETEALFADLETWVAEAGERMRRELGRDLKQACADAGLEFTVVTREAPIEVRIPPFSVVLDFDRGQADFRFARQSVGLAAADATAILDEHRKALARFETAFDPAAFFDRCHGAWRAARAARGIEGERVEILDFLPYLALEMQSGRFHADPSSATFKAYGRAQFAYDVLRLRRAKGLVQGGARLNLGVATGTTASQKKRVIYFEDEHGNGEYKLTVFFSRQPESTS